MTHREALEDWQLRFDIEKHRGNSIGMLALMGELANQLRPDIWERNEKIRQWRADLITGTPARRERQKAAKRGNAHVDSI